MRPDLQVSVDTIMTLSSCVRQGERELNSLLRVDATTAKVSLHINDGDWDIPIAIEDVSAILKRRAADLKASIADATLQLSQLLGAKP